MGRPAVMRFPTYVLFSMLNERLYASRGPAMNVLVAALAILICVSPLIADAQDNLPDAGTRLTPEVGEGELRLSASLGFGTLATITDRFRARLELRGYLVSMDGNGEFSARLQLQEVRAR